MKLGQLNNRAVLITDGGAIDIATATSGAFGPSLQAIYEDFDNAKVVLADLDLSLVVPFDLGDLQSPTPAPRQVFAIGLNYGSHAEEAGLAIPTVPATFTKFPSSLSGPFSDIELSGDTVDWEVEVVAVIGRTAEFVAEAEAWSYVAGLTVGQDISDRTLQFAAAGQFSLGKSYRGYGPVGPWLVTVDEFDNPDDLELGCSINGEEMQRGRSSDLIFSIPKLIAELSKVLPLWPGDLIFTGTPAGVGIVRQPARFLSPGDELVSWVEGIGEIRNHCRPLTSKGN
jgi:2-keto-4-pentenoate hydratase/2-oxohepta-3-ene-1,7-dioic acid hydratase in catechol pathway